jgi:outer membrane protein assembly factor BamB
MPLRRSFFYPVLSVMAALPLFSQDWPMWGGTIERNMVSAVQNLPESWDVQSGENIKWEVQVGTTSYGNPVVAGGKVFIGTNNGNPRDAAIQGDKGVLMCFRESDGKFLWQAVTDKLDSGWENDFTEQGVCSSPAVERDRLYYVSNRGELVCLDTEGFMDGENDGWFQEEARKGAGDADIVWKLDLIKELGVFPLYMSNSSPVIWENLLFLETSNGRDSNDEKVVAPKAPSFLAVDKNTGRVWWRDNSPGEGILHGQWASPALGLVDGIEQAVFPGGDGWLYGFNARSGEKLWKFDMNPKDAVWPKTRNYGVATPVFSEGKVFISVGQDPENGIGAGHAYCIDPAKRGDITGTGLVWRYDAINRSLSTAAVVDGLVYISDLNGFLHCLDRETGKPYWTYDMMAPVWGSPLAADGKVYLGDQDGDITVFRSGREMKKISEIDMGNSVYGTPVPANGVLYILTSQKLFAVAGTPGGNKK